MLITTPLKMNTISQDSQSIIDLFNQPLGDKDFKEIHGEILDIYEFYRTGTPYEGGVYMIDIGDFELNIPMITSWVTDDEEELFDSLLVGSRNFRVFDDFDDVKSM